MYWANSRIKRNKKKRNRGLYHDFSFLRLDHARSSHYQKFVNERGNFVRGEGTKAQFTWSK